MYSILSDNFCRLFSMGTLKITVIFVLLSSLCHESVQGFAPGRLRDLASIPDVPGSVQELSSTLTIILQAVQEGVKGSKLAKAMKSIAEQADQILQETESSILDQDVKDLIAGLSTDYQPLLDSTLELGIKRLDLAFELLKDLADKLNYTENDDLYVTVAAIGTTAEEIAKNAAAIEKLYIHIFNEISKRQNSEWAYNGKEFSHTWNHDDGSNSTVGGKFGWNSGGLNGDLHGSHTWNTGNGQATVGGHLGGSSSGLKGGISGSYEWNNGRTSLGGNLDFDSSGNPSGGITFSHRFRRIETAEW